MSIEIVQDHMELSSRIFGHQIVHEIQKLASAPAPVVTCMHQTASHLQGGKEGRRAVALVLMSKAGHGSTVGQSNPSLCPLQSLNAGLMIQVGTLRWL